MTVGTPAGESEEVAHAVAWLTAYLPVLKLNGMAAEVSCVLAALARAEALLAEARETTAKIAIESDQLDPTIDAHHDAEAALTAIHQAAAALLAHLGEP